jgi:hypothetical protein
MKVGMVRMVGCGYWRPKLVSNLDQGAWTGGTPIDCSLMNGGQREVIDLTPTRTGEGAVADSLWTGDSRQ